MHATLKFLPGSSACAAESPFLPSEQFDEDVANKLVAVHCGASVLLPFSSQVIKALQFVTVMKSGASAALLTDHGHVAPVSDLYIQSQSGHTAISLV